MRKHIFSGLLVMVLLAASFLAACERSASQIIPPTPTGTTVSPLSGSTLNEMENLRYLATQTSMAATRLAGGTGLSSNSQTPAITGTPGTQIPNATGGSTASTFTAASKTATLSAINPVYLTPTPGRPAQHTIMPSEYPYCLARRFNVDPGELLTLNPQVANLAENEIPTGTILTIPQTGNPYPGDRSWHDHPTTYTAPEEMTIYKVACYFGDIDPSVIIYVNNLTSPYNVHAGQTLAIP